MKYKLILASLALTLAHTAQGQTTFTWTKGNPSGANLVANPDLWTTSSNWSGSTVPAFGTDNIVHYSLNATNLYTGHSTSMNGDRTLGGLIFGQSGVSYAVGARIYINNTGALTLATSSDMPTIEVHSTIADIAADIRGNQGLYKSGPGRLNMNVTAKTYTGTTHVNEGSLLSNAAIASQDFIVDEDGELFFSGSFTQTANTISSVGLLTLSNTTFDVNSSVDNTISGTIQNGSSTGKLRKSGTGRLTLEGSNTYTGTTTVAGGVLEIAGGASIARGATVNNGGTLQVDGGISAGGSYSTSVQAGGTLTGSGVIGGATTISGIHSPGNSPGIQTFESNLTYNNGSTLVWELTDNTNNPLDRGTSYDGIDVNGNVTINISAIVDLNFDLAGSTVDWTNTLWDESITGTNGWLLFDVAGTTTGTQNLSTVSTNTMIDSNGVSLSSARPAGEDHVAAYFYFTQVGDDVYLNYAVPEPTTALLSVLGTLALLRRRRA